MTPTDAGPDRPTPGTTLVERLRACAVFADRMNIQPDADDLREAADEIERLTRELQQRRATAIDRCPYCANPQCVCTHEWGDSCRCQPTPYQMVTTHCPYCLRLRVEGCIHFPLEPQPPQGPAEVSRDANVLPQGQAALVRLRALIEEVWTSHRDRYDGHYNQCEEDECAWCQETREALDAMSASLERRAAQGEPHRPLTLPADRSALIAKAVAADDSCIAAQGPALVRERLHRIANELNTVHEPERGADQRPPMVVVLERWEECVRLAREALAALDAQPEVG